MAEGKDYFVEEITVTGKETELIGATGFSTARSFFFCYGDSGQRMQVPQHVYREYEVGDRVSAYTADHIRYGYDMDAVLPADEFRGNEVMKGAGGFLGIGIFFLVLFCALRRRTD